MFTRGGHFRTVSEMGHADLILVANNLDKLLAALIEEMERLARELETACAVVSDFVRALTDPTFSLAGPVP